MGGRVIRGQVKLHRNSLPEAVSVFEDAVSGNIARQNWHGIHWHLLEVGSEPVFQTRRESLHEGFLHLFRAQCTTGNVPDFAFHRWQMANVLREKVNLGASRFAVGPTAAHFTFARHRAVIVCHRHRQQHLCVKVIGKHAVESQVMERRIVSICVLNGVRHEPGQIVD